MSSFRGNVVLMDFWAWYCVPCREGFKILKSLYHTYHSKGFEIIAVNSDMMGNVTKWKQAISNDSVSEWIHVPVAKDVTKGSNGITKEDIYYNYFEYGQGIPIQILIDKDGKIIGSWNGKSEKNEKELKTKLEVLFDK